MERQPCRASRQAKVVTVRDSVKAPAYDFSGESILDYRNRCEAGNKLLVCQTSPVSEESEVTGHACNGSAIKQGRP